MSTFNRTPIFFFFLNFILISVQGMAKVTLYNSAYHDEGEGKTTYEVTEFGCQRTLHSWSDKVSSIHTHDTCVILWEHEDCSGASIVMRPGTQCHEHLGKCTMKPNYDWNDEVSSISGCHYSGKCYVKSWNTFAPHNPQTGQHALIVGGSETARHEFPFTVSVQVPWYYYWWQHMCGGVIHSSTVILTAAHCCDGYQSWHSHIRIVAGAHNLNENDESRQHRSVSDIYVYPQYQSDGDRSYDICKIVLSEPLDLSKPEVRRYRDCPREPDDCTLCTVVGWGKVSTNGLPSNALRKVRVLELDRTSCSIAWGRVIMPPNICAGGMVGRGVCDGDSGGPLLCQHPTEDGECLSGLTSYGTERGCAIGVPDVYVSIRNPNVQSFINRN